MNAPARDTSIGFPAWWLCALILGIFSSLYQLRLQGFFDINSGYQYTDHLTILAGKDIAPFQYRILSVYVTEWVITLMRHLPIEYPVYAGFALVKLLQNTAIFILAGLFYRRIGLPDSHAVIGLCLLATATVHTLWLVDMALNSYNDLLFYLIGALLILGHRIHTIVPLMVVAALNRETSGLIPVMLAALHLRLARLAARAQAPGLGHPARLDVHSHGRRQPRRNPPAAGAAHVDLHSRHALRPPAPGPPNALRRHGDAATAVVGALL